MKLFYTLLIPVLFIVSCNDSEEENTEKNNTLEQKSDNEEELTPSEMLSKRWVLVKRTNSKQDKVIEFDEQNSSVITFFEDNGYFRVYDSLTDLDKKHGVKKIEQRQSGQWEISNDKLILRYTQPDTVIVEELIVEKLEKSELVLKNVQKDQVNKYIIK